MKLPRNPVNGWVVASVQSPELNSWLLCCNWCRSNFKHANWRYVGAGVFEFRRVDDYMMFMLRW
jgi:hypothetical protein